MAFTDKQKRALAEPINLAHVKTRAVGGKSRSYLEGWFVIDELNDIFGADGWSYTISEIVVHGPFEAASNTGAQVVYAASARVRLTIGDVIREDVGGGSGVVGARSSTAHPDAIEGATKEAVTDGLKRCARTLGPRLGNALYDKTGSMIATAEQVQGLRQTYENEPRREHPALSIAATAAQAPIDPLRDATREEFDRLCGIVTKIVEHLPRTRPEALGDAIMRAGPHIARLEALHEAEPTGGWFQLLEAARDAVQIASDRRKDAAVEMWTTHGATM